MSLAGGRVGAGPEGRVADQTEDEDGESGEETGSRDASLSKDAVFEVLKNRRRRDVLDHLWSTDGTATLSDLAEQIAARENDVPVEAIDSTQRKRVYVALYQTHLPKMDETGVVDYDSDRGTVGLAENADLVNVYLGDEFGHEDAWHRRYVALSLAGGAALGLSYLAGSTALPTATTLGVVGLFLLVSLVHARDRRRARRHLQRTLDRIE